MSYRLDEQEAAELRMEDRLRRQYERRLREHPNCRDPDHPGCDNCDDIDTTQEHDNDH